MTYSINTVDSGYGRYWKVYVIVDINLSKMYELEAVLNEV